MHRMTTDAAGRPAPRKPLGGSLLTRTLGVAIALGGAQAWAQNALPSRSSDPTPPPKKDDATQLGKVAVYGEDLEPVSPKFTAPIVDTPMSVTILPASVMQETAATSLQDALRNVPGITFAAGEGGTPTGDLPSIRGFDSAGSIYVDGMRDIGIQTRDIFDLEQVEVVKGPDSTISGRAAGGGAIDLISKTAEADDFAEVTGTYGSAGQYRAAFDGNVNFGDGIAARLNVVDMGGGVPGRSNAVRMDKLGIAPTITFGLQTSTRLTLDYYHFEDRSTPDYGIPVDYIATGKPLDVNPENFYGLRDRDFRHNPVDSGEARIEHDFGQTLTLRSQVRYTVSENDYVLTLPYLATNFATGDLEPGLVYRLPIGNNDRTRGLISQTDLSGHFDTGPIHHDLDFGFEYSDEKQRLLGGGAWEGYNVVSPAGTQGFSGGDCSDPALTASYDCTSLAAPNPYDPWQGSITPNTSEIANFTTDDYAPYAFDTITLTPQWKINSGLRWDRYDTSASDPANPTDWGGADRQSFLSYQVGIMFKPLENGTIYLMSSSASIPEDEAASNAQQDESYPSVPGSYQGTLDLKPEVTRTVELGTKWNLFANRLLVSGDVFDEKHTNTPIYLSADATAAAQVGETGSKGVELSANGSITGNWNLIAGYSYLDARITRGSYYDEVGKQVPNTPPNTFSLWSTYRPVPVVTVGAGAYYRDRQVGYAGPPDEAIDGYWRFDAMAKWQVDPHFDLQLNVQNIGNTSYFSKIFYWYAVPGIGRTWMMTADMRF